MAPERCLEHHLGMIKLLVVDDSELIRSRFVGWLQGIPGMSDIDTAGTLEQTLNRVEAGRHSLVILDLNLPDGNAIQIIPTLRQLAPDMQIVVLTNDASDFNRDKCMQAGADSFFDKSREFEKVLVLIQLKAALH